MAAHDAPARFARCYTHLRTHLPDFDRALIGWPAILEHLNARLHLCRPNGAPITIRMVWRWRRDFACPILRGGWNAQLHHHLAPPLTSSHALTAWVLAQFDAAHRRPLFGVSLSASELPDGKAPEQSEAARIAERRAA